MRTEETRHTLAWRAAGAGVLLVAWALDAAWWRRWRQRWDYGSLSAGAVLAGRRWERNRQTTGGLR